MGEGAIGRRRDDEVRRTEMCLDSRNSTSEGRREMSKEQGVERGDGETAG